MNLGDEMSQAKHDPTPPWRRKAAEMRKQTAWQFYLLYCRWFYRAHMRWLHKRGRHKWKHFALHGGPEFDKCEWCGAMQYPNARHNAFDANEKDRDVALNEMPRS